MSIFSSILCGSFIYLRVLSLSSCIELQVGNSAATHRYPFSLIKMCTCHVDLDLQFVSQIQWVIPTALIEKTKNSKKKNSNDKLTVNVFLSSQLSLQASQVTFIPFCWWFHFCQWSMQLFILTHGTFQLFYLYFPITNYVAMCRELFLSQSNIKHTHEKWEINNSYHSGAWFEMGKQMFWTKGLFLQEFHTPVIFPFTKPIFFFLGIWWRNWKGSKSLTLW